MIKFNQLLNLAESNIVPNTNLIQIDSLSEEVQEDIAANLSEHVQYLIISDWTTEDIVGSLSYAMIPLLQLSVNVMYAQMLKQRGRVNDAGVNSLMSALKAKNELDPIIVNNKRFFDGGHRVAAYKMLGRKTIPAVDIATLLNVDWNKLMNDPKYSAPPTIPQQQLY